MVGHNIERFDVPFLNNDLRRKGRPVVDQKRVVDTLNISRMMYGRKPTEHIKHHNLRSCAMRERSPSYTSSGHHSAGQDVEVTAEVFASMMGKVV